MSAVLVVGARVRVCACEPRWGGRVGEVVKLPKHFADMAYVRLDPAPRERVEKVEMLERARLEVLP